MPLFCLLQSAGLTFVGSAKNKNNYIVQSARAKTFTYVTTKKASKALISDDSCVIHPCCSEARVAEIDGSTVLSTDNVTSGGQTLASFDFRLSQLLHGSIWIVDVIIGRCGVGCGGILM